jgi:protease-4
MSIETDLLIDRRRLKRRLFLWRGISVVAVLACALVAIGRADLAVLGPHIARLNISGIITEDRKLTEAVAKLAHDSSVRALIVSVDSPGGSVSGGESLHDAIVKVAAAKPVVAVMGGTAASAAYMISVPAARIFAREATLTGSIGVILETGDVSALLARIGISADPIVSGPLKDQPSFVKPLSPQGHEVLQGLVMDLYEQFVAMVAIGRQMDPARVRQLGDGRAYTGRQAIKLGLVDEIGGEAEARDWLAAQRKVAATLPVVDVTTRTLASRTLGESLTTVAGDALKSLMSQGLSLDGAWALWQPAHSGG